MKSKRKITNRVCRVVDCHTGETVKRYTREAAARYAAEKLCKENHSPKRYKVEPIVDVIPRLVKPSPFR